MSDDRLSLQLRARRGGFDLDIEAEIPLDGITAVFGPSGSGKTSLLRLVAGLDRPDEGRIAMGDTVWVDRARHVFTPAHQRPVGLVFQDARLFSHLSVAGNLAYAQRRAATGPTRFDSETIIKALDLAPLLPRRPASLSGGEAQRVALARALLTQPRLLLLDEPMAGLDHARKAELLPYLDTTLRQLEIPALYVSHSVEEVVRLSDRVLALSQGRCVAMGPVEEVFARLEIEPLERDFEAGSILAGQLIDQNERLQLSRVDIGGQVLELPMSAALQPGDTVRLRIRARDVAIATLKPQAISIRNVLDGRIIAISENETSPYADLTVSIGTSQLKARLTRASIEALELAPGQAVYALVKSASFDRGPG
ncbi:molybdenum ABC transporter ATP-binding protein [Maricaulis sp.]|uniref:molybdenum ABC transporter ATP-binding protein n=1 Tax=Maricaulis sp. TaxID=1486257 RepID=UPI003A9386BA